MGDAVELSMLHARTLNQKLNSRNFRTAVMVFDSAKARSDVLKGHLPRNSKWPFMLKDASKKMLASKIT